MTDAIRLLVVGICLLPLLSAQLPAQVARPVDIHFEESGIGSITFPPAGVIVPFSAVGNGVDPLDPTNGLTPLIYDLSGTPTLGTPVPGDVVVREPGGGAVSDLLRFTGQGQLIVYSAFTEAGDPGHEAADVGIPNSRQANQVAVSETSVGSGVDEVAGYTPTPDQPGYLTPPTGTISVTYTFTSEVPEPGAVGVMIAAVALRRRRATGAWG